MSANGNLLGTRDQYHATGTQERGLLTTKLEQWLYCAPVVNAPNADEWVGMLP